MLCMTSDEILARRREQNRLAQRRFREGKQSQRKVSKPSQSRKRPDSAQRGAELYQSSSSSPEPSSDDGLIDLLLANFQASELSSETTGDMWSNSIEPGIQGDTMTPCFDSIIGLEPSEDFLLLPDPCQKVPYATPIGAGHFATLSSAKEHSQHSPFLNLTVLPSAATNLSQSTQRHAPHSEPFQRQYGQGVKHDSASYHQVHSVGPLHIAARDGHDRIVQALVDHGADCNQPDSQGLTALDHAIISGHDDIVMTLLLHKAQLRSLNVDLQTALHLAVCYRRETALSMILSHSDQAMSLIDEIDSIGRAPLHIAVNIGFEAGVRILLRFGADPNCMAGKFWPTTSDSYSGDTIN